MSENEGASPREVPTPTATETKKRSRLWTVIGFVVVAGGLIGMKYCDQGEADADVKGQAAEVVSQLPDYAGNEEYYASLIETAHPTAFDDSYRMGGRRTSSKFDDERYLQLLFQGMADQAQADGRTEIVGTLRLALLSLRSGPGESR